MCGIAGFMGTGDKQTLERMTSVLAHRGPDGSDLLPYYSGFFGRVE